MASDKAREYVSKLFSRGAEMRAAVPPRTPQQINQGPFAGEQLHFGANAQGAFEPPPEQSLGQRVLESTVPAMAATMVGGPIGGRVAGGLGRLAGETLAAGGVGSLGLGGGPSGGVGAAIGAGGNLLGAGIGAGLGRLAENIPGVGGWIGKQLGRIPGAQEADRALATKGEGLLLSQAFESPIVQNAERIFDTAVLGRGALGRAQQRGSAAAKEMAEDYVSGLINSSGRQDVGDTIEQFLTNKHEVFQAGARKMYAQIDQASKGGVLVDIRPVQETAANLLKSGAITGKAARDLLEQVIPPPNAAGMMPSALSGHVSFEQAAKMRSSLLAVGREGEGILPEQAQQYAKKLAPYVEMQMERAAQSLDPVLGGRSPRLWQAWRAAQDYYRAGAEPFNDAGIKAIMRKQPEAIAQYLVPLSGNFKTTTIQALKRISRDDPLAMETLRSHYVSELLRASRNDAGDVLARADNPASTQFISGAKLLDKMSGDVKALDELLGPQTRKSLMGLANAMARAEKKPGALGSATLGTGVQYARIAALTGGSGLAFHLGGPEIGAGAAATIIVAPSALNHMLANPTLRRWLIGGGPPPGAKTLSRGIGQIISHAMLGQRRFGRDSIIIQPGGIPAEPPGPLQVGLGALEQRPGLPPPGPMSPEALQALRTLPPPLPPAGSPPGGFGQ